MLFSGIPKKVLSAVSTDANEFAHIDWIRTRVGGQSGVRLGIGDDAAAVRLPETTDCLVTVDMLMEGVHFTIPPATAQQIGRKTLAVNLSDIAAMAGRPRSAVVAVALNRHRGIDFARELHDGIQQLADEFDVAIAGGDTNVWDGPVVVSLTLLGEPTGDGPVRRSGARAGDWIMTTGRFGGSLAGRHLTFRPRVEEALKLNESVRLNAMIDVSDGLVADLFHILDESGVGAVLEADTIPIHPQAGQADDGRTALEHALADGEDFELLLTVAPSEGRTLLEHPPVKTELSKIGEIVEQRGCELADPSGQTTPLGRRGWLHTF